MPKIKDSQVKVFEQKVGTSDTVQALFENDGLTSITFFGANTQLPIINYMSDLDRAYDLYNALHELFGETGLDPKNKNERRLQLPKVSQGNSQPQQ